MLIKGAGQRHMIELTRLNKKTLFVNSDLIEIVEETPDTVITLTNGRKLVVTDTASEIIDKVVAFRYRCFHKGRLQLRKGERDV